MRQVLVADADNRAHAPAAVAAVRRFLAGAGGGAWLPGLFSAGGDWRSSTRTTAWWEQLVYFVDGRVVVSGREDAPLLDTAVVLVPALADPDASGVLRLYSRIDRGAPLAGVERPEDAAIWLWTDVDGWFGSTHLALGVPYRIEVRRAGCRPVVFGLRRFRLLNFWSRRLHLEVLPCGVAL